MITRRESFIWYLFMTNQNTRLWCNSGCTKNSVQEMWSSCLPLLLTSKVLVIISIEERELVDLFSFSIIHIMIINHSFRGRNGSPQQNDMRWNMKCLVVLDRTQIHGCRPLKAITNLPLFCYLGWVHSNFFTYNIRIFWTTI